MTKLTLFTSWPLKSGAGSGVVSVVQSLYALLSSSKDGARLLSPSFKPNGYIGTSFKRISFNISADLSKHHAIVAFDFDGFLLKKGVKFASVNGGLLGDLIRFESGFIAMTLRLLAWLEKQACKKAEVVFTPSLYAKEKIVSLYKTDSSKVVVMPNGIFYEEWVEKVDSAKVDNKRELTVLTVARLYKRKGIDNLIKAWPSVLAKHPKAILRIVGDGLERRSLLHLRSKLDLDDSIIFEGEVRDRNHLARFYANSDIFCLPSMHETFGLVFLEAMAAGKAVVALNSTAVPEVVRQGVDGLLVEPNDNKALAMAINSLLGDRHLSARMGNDGRKRVKAFFRWQDVTAPLIKWINSDGDL